MVSSLLLLLPVVASIDTDVLVAEGNPHQATCAEDGTSGPACTSCPAQALPPDLFLPQPVALALETQADTFQRVVMARHGGVPVPIFHFKQPSRLSEAELPFGIALMTGVDERGLTQLAVPQHDADDSWFEGYSWTHVLLCSSPAEQGGGLHLGWRYVRKPGVPAGLGRPKEFVALIVRPDKSSEPEATGRAKLPTAEELMVGIEAPAWMMALAMATRVRSK